MDALLKALEQRGYDVASGPVVQILDVRVRFSISEALDTQREQPKDHDLDGDMSLAIAGSMPSEFPLAA